MKPAEASTDRFWRRADVRGDGSDVAEMVCRLVEFLNTWSGATFAALEN